MAEEKVGNPNALTIVEDLLRVLSLLAAIVKLVVEVFDRQNGGGGPGVS